MLLAKPKMPRVRASIAEEAVRGLRNLPHLLRSSRVLRLQVVVACSLLLQLAGLAHAQVSSAPETAARARSEAATSRQTANEPSTDTGAPSVPPTATATPLATVAMPIVPKPAPAPRAAKEKYFSLQTDVAYEVYNFNRRVAYTAPGLFPLTGQTSLLRTLEKTRAKVTRTTVNESFGWRINKDWNLDIEVPWATASFSGLIGDLQRPPTLGLSGGSVTNAVVDAGLRHQTDAGYTGVPYGVELTASPGVATQAGLSLSSLKDITVHPHWQISDPAKTKNPWSADFNFRLPTGHARLTPDEQVLVSALGEASLDANDPYFGKGFDAGFRLNWMKKASSNRQFDFSGGFTMTGEYEQTYSTQLNQLFDQGVPAIESAIETEFSTDLPPQVIPTANSRLITRRNPADQLFIGAAMTQRKGPKRRDQYALSSSFFFDESATAPAGILRGNSAVALGDQAPSKVNLKKDPTYQVSYTQDRQLGKKSFGRLRVFYQVQGINDVLPPTGFVVQDVSFGDRYGLDLQLRLARGPNRSISYGLRSNNIDQASLISGGSVPSLGVVNSERHELSAFVGTDMIIKEFKLGAQLRLGLTDDAPDLVAQVGVRKEF